MLSLREARQQAEKAAITAALAETGSMREAAVRLGIGFSTLKGKLAALGIRTRRQTVLIE